MAPATEPRLAIVSVGRSGSGYIAAVLNAAGVACGHEQWWNPQGDRAPGLVADSSWCALPDLLEGFAGRVVHQVRHPLLTVASLAALPDHAPYTAVREQIMGALAEDPLIAAIDTYLAWNRKAEQISSRRWRVEDVDPQLVTELASLAGVLLGDGAAAAAVRNTPRNVNDHATPVTLDWDDLPATSATAELHDMAGRYGYL